MATETTLRPPTPGGGTAGRLRLSAAVMLALLSVLVLGVLHACGLRGGIGVLWQALALMCAASLTAVPLTALRPPPSAPAACGRRTPVIVAAAAVAVAMLCSWLSGRGPQPPPAWLVVVAVAPAFALCRLLPLGPAPSGCDRDRLHGAIIAGGLVLAVLQSFVSYALCLLIWQEEAERYAFANAHRYLQEQGDGLRYYGWLLLAAAGALWVLAAWARRHRPGSRLRRLSPWLVALTAVALALLCAGAIQVPTRHVTLSRTLSEVELSQGLLRLMVVQLTSLTLIWSVLIRLLVGRHMAAVAGRRLFRLLFYLCFTVTLLAVPQAVLTYNAARGRALTTVIFAAAATAWLVCVGPGLLFLAVRPTAAGETEEGGVHDA